MREPPPTAGSSSAMPHWPCSRARWTGSRPGAVASWRWRPFTATARPPCSTPRPNSPASADYEVLTARGREFERELELGVALQLFEARVGEATGAERERMLRARPAPRSRSSTRGRPRRDRGSGVTGARPVPAHGEHRRRRAARPGHRRRGHGRCRHATASSSIWRAGSSRCRSCWCWPSARPWRTWAPTRWRRWCPTPATRHLTLEQLSAAGTAAWLRASFFPDAHDRFCEAVHEASAGSPWLVGELCRELAAAGVTPDEAAVARFARPPPSRSPPRSCAAPAPSTPDAAVLLEAAAVLGPGAEVRHAAGLTGLPRQRVAALMDGLAAIGVLVGDERISFVHPLVEASVHAALPAGERAEAHLWAARALTDDDAPADLVASHLLRAGRGGGEWVTPVAADGRDAGARHRRRRACGRAARTRAPGAASPGPAGARAARAGAALRRLRGRPRRSAAWPRRSSGCPSPASGPERRSRPGACSSRSGRLEDAVAAFDLGIRSAGTARESSAGCSAPRAPPPRDFSDGQVSRPAAGPSGARSRRRPANRALLAQLALDAALRGDPHQQVRELAVRGARPGSAPGRRGCGGDRLLLRHRGADVAEDLQMAEVALAAAVDDARSRGSRSGLPPPRTSRASRSCAAAGSAAAAAAARAAMAG